jgi:lipoprotein NlpD
LAGCGSKPVSRSASSPAARAATGMAGKPGYYTVKPGDTLGSIGLATGQSWRDIARWNGLQNPNQLEVGQVLRLQPADGPAGAGTAVARAPSTPAVAGGGKPVTPLSRESLALVWPASGRVVAEFDGNANRGIDLEGKPGEAVLASADGTVMYVGDEVRGLGNVVMIRHNDSFLTAYAHNQLVLVKDGQQVRKGQRIAEMGNSGTDRVKLHFELRQVSADGLTHPLDPLKYLPAR